MFKIFLQLVAIHGVLCAPPAPFLEYGTPSIYKLEEMNESPIKQEGTALLPTSVKNLPGSEAIVEKTEFSVDLPGTRNLDEKSIPDSVTRNFNEENKWTENLPGTRNLAEKTIPDSITLRKIPSLPEDLLLPRNAYDGGFLQPKVKEFKPQENEEGFKIYQNPTLPNQEGTEVQETKLFPGSKSPQHTFVSLPSLPENINNGGKLQNTFVQPASAPKPVDNQSSDQNKLKIQPGTSIKVQDNHGQYSQGYSNPDGTQVQESGRLISTDDGWEYVIAKEGSYQYVSPEGYHIHTRYIADEKGFRILSQSFVRP